MSESDKQIVELQSRILFQDDVIQKLDAVVIKQSEVLDHVVRRLAVVEERLEQLNYERESQLSPSDEKPPHY